MLLPRGLRRGHWMELDDRDIRALTQAVGLPQVGHEVPAYVARKAQDAQASRNKRGRNADRGRAGPRPSAGPLSARDQRQEQARDNRMRSARAGFGKPGGRSGDAWPAEDDFVDRRTAEGRGGRGGNAGRGGQGGPGRGGQGGQPDPLRTSQGYIGADSFFRQRKSEGPGRGRKSGGVSGGGGGGRKRSSGRGPR
jgi:23S rRNA pseudouridine2605 synthase